MQKVTTNPLEQPLRELDGFITQLAANAAVDIIPGETDPSNWALPQQPLHRCLFPSSRTYSSFTSTSNPMRGSVDGVDVCGTAGQNLDNLRAYSDATKLTDVCDRLDASPLVLPFSSRLHVMSTVHA